MKNPLQMGPRCAQNIPLASCDRKTLELALKELVSSNNKIRQELIQSHPNKKTLEKILVIKRAHHAFLKQLFDRCDFSKTRINTEDNKVYPSLRGLSNRLNYSKSHLYSIKRHLREIGLIKTISRRIEISPDGETRTTSDEYFFGQRILDLAELTVLARKPKRVEEEEAKVTKLLTQLEQVIQVEKSIHQKNGEKGLAKKRKLNELIEDLEEIANVLEKLESTDQEENFKKLRTISSEFKKINKKIDSENQSPLVQKEKPSLLKSDSPSMKIPPEILPLKSSHEILIINTPPPVQNSKNAPSEAKEKKPSNNEDDFEKIFNRYLELFGRRSSIKEKKLFKENYHASDWTSDELLDLLNIFGKDRYLKATTTSINRIFDAERVLSIIATVKKRLLKEKYDKEIIQPLGSIEVLKEIFLSVTDITKWANEEIGGYSNGE